MQRPCLDVTDLGMSIAEIRDRLRQGIPPDTAEEFLVRVKLEAAELPDVVEATHIDSRVYVSRQTRYMPAQPELPSCPPDRLPSEQWERDVAMAFLDMRQSLGRLSEKHAFNRQRAIKVPPLKHETAWLYFLYGSQKAGADVQTEDADSGAGVSMEDEVAMEEPETSPVKEPSSGDAAPVDPSAFGGPYEPHVSLVLQFDNVMTVRLLRYHAKWLEAKSCMPAEYAAWTYALLARLETPLTVDTAALVRQLYRRCFTLRATLCVDGQDTAELCDQLGRLNTLLAITGHFFRQGEVSSTVVCDVWRETAMASTQPVVGATMSMDPSDWDMGMDEDEEEEDMMEEEEGKGMGAMGFVGGWGGGAQQHQPEVEEVEEGEVTEPDMHVGHNTVPWQAPKAEVVEEEEKEEGEI